MPDGWPYTPVTLHYSIIMPITAFGQSLSVDEWSAHSGIKPATIRARLYRGGWSTEDAVGRQVPRRDATAWRKDYTVVISGAASGEPAHETAERLGWTEERVLRMRGQAVSLLGARNLVNAVAILARDGKIEF